jgi:hypothetical protein
MHGGRRLQRCLERLGVHSTNADSKSHTDAVQSHRLTARMAGMQIGVMKTDTELTWRRFFFVLVNGRSPGARRVSAFIIVLILANVVLVIVDTEPDIATGPGTSFRTAYWWFELFSCTVFISEYCVRVWCCVERWPSAPHLQTRMEWCTSPLATIDLFSILPFIYDLSFEKDHRLRGGSLIRTLRIFTLLRLERNFRSFSRVFRVLSLQRRELGVAAFVACILLLVSASLIYCAEGPERKGREMLLWPAPSCINCDKWDHEEGTVTVER